MPSRNFASPPIECWTIRNKVHWFFKNIQTTSIVTQHYIPEGRIVQQWKLFMNIVTFISDCSHGLCLIGAAEADALCHIQKRTIWQLSNKQSDTSQFTLSQHIEEKNWHLIRPFNWTWILVHIHTATSQTQQHTQNWHACGFVAWKYT